MAHDQDAEDDDVLAWAEEMIADGWVPMGHDREVNRQVEAHIERCFGKAQTILHELYSKHIHLDIYVIPPSEGRDFTVYVTSGMSDLAMTPPPAAPDWTRLELLIALPGPPESHGTTRAAWKGWHYLIHELKSHARYPHATGKWLYWSHTIMSTATADPIGPDTTMGAFILQGPLVTPIVPDREAFECRLSNGETVRFLTLNPIYRDELAFALEHGGDVLLQRLHQAGVTEIYDRARPSVLARKPGFDWKRLWGRPM